MIIVGLLGIGSAVNSYLNSRIWARFVVQTGDIPFDKS
jgi:hypothetical protein